jgi:hypothetical protein
MLSASRQVSDRTPMLTSPHRPLPVSYPRASPRPAPRGLQPSRSLVWQARASLGTKGMRKTTRCRQTPSAWTAVRFAGQGARASKASTYVYGGRLSTVGAARPRPAGPRCGPAARAAAGWMRCEYSKVTHTRVVSGTGHCGFSQSNYLYTQKRGTEVESRSHMRLSNSVCVGL